VWRNLGHPSGERIALVPPMQNQSRARRHVTRVAFKRVLIDRCLIPGGYLSDAGIAMLVRHAERRLTREPVDTVHADRGAGGGPDMPDMHDGDGV